MINVEEALRIKDNFAKYKGVRSILIKDSDITYQPKVSICIPTYNRINTLKDTLESALSQCGFTNYNIIVSDNNPERNDSTEQYMKTIKDPRVKYYKNKQGIGMYGNINRLIEESDGQYTVIIHDDDILFPSFLHDTMVVMASHPLIDILYPNKFYWHQDKNEPKPKPKQQKKQYKIHKISLWDFLMGTYAFQPSGFIFKTQIIKDLGGFDFDSWPSNDCYFALKATCHVSVYFFSKPLWIYRFSVNLSLKKEILIGFMKVDVPMKKWIAKQNFKYRFLYYPSYLEYCESYYKWFRQSHPEAPDTDVSPYIYIHFTDNERIELILYRKVLWLIRKFRGHFGGLKVSVRSLLGRSRALTTR